MQITAPQMMSPTLISQASGLGAPTDLLALQQQQQQQMLALAADSAASQQAAMGAVAVKPKSTFGTILKNMVVTAGLGAAVGAGLTFLPFIPGGPLTGALIGAGAGALLGLIRGVRSARRQKDEQSAMMMGSQNLPTDPNALGPVLSVEPEAAAISKVAVKIAKPAGKTHTVKSGDTLSAVAHKYHVTVAELHAANRKAIGANANMIHLGARLVIPKHHKAKH